MAAATPTVADYQKLIELSNAFRLTYAQFNDAGQFPQTAWTDVTNARAALAAFIKANPSVTPVPASGI
jgi:hypothetical protein